MKRWFSARLAGTILLAAFAALAVFHVLVLLGAAPPNIVLGGAAAGSPNFALLEGIALLVTLLFALIVAVRLGYLDGAALRRAARWAVWLIFAYLLLNTAGNLASASSFEAYVFAPLTFVLALCALRLALEK